MKTIGFCTFNEVIPDKWLIHEIRCMFNSVLPVLQVFCCWWLFLSVVLKSKVCVHCALYTVTSPAQHIYNIQHSPCILV